MASALKPVDMTGAVVGQTFTIDFTPFPVVDVSGIFNHQPQDLPKAHIVLYNESGAGIHLDFKNSGNSHVLPAGGWNTFELQSNDTQIVVTVLYLLPNPPVSTLAPVYIKPGEEPPSNFQLGNSPVGIGGSVNTSNVQTLSNEGTAAGLLVIDIGDAVGANGFAQILTIFNDGHCLWSVDQSNVKHQVIKVNTSGNPLQLGQSGDTTEVLGNFLTDGTLSITGASTFTGDITANGAGTSILAAHDIRANGNMIVNADLELIDNGANIRPFAFINASTNDTTIATNANNKILHIINSALNADIATFADTLITALAGELDINKAATTVNGSVAGSCIFTAPIWGSALKVLVVQVNGWNSASVATFIFPATFGFGGFICGNQGAMTWGLNIGATAQTIHAIKTLGNNTTAGTDDALTAIRSNTVGWVDLSPGADRIVVGTTGGAVITSTIVLVGF